MRLNLLGGDLIDSLVDGLLDGLLHEQACGASDREVSDRVDHLEERVGVPGGEGAKDVSGHSRRGDAGADAERSANEENGVHGGSFLSGFIIGHVNMTGAQTNPDPRSEYSRQAFFASSLATSVFMRSRILGGMTPSMKA